MIHPSSLTLERLSVGDLPAEASQAATQHVSGCEPCQAFLDELEGGRDAFLREWPRERILARLQASRIPLLRRWRWAGLIAAAACAAVALLFVARPEERIQLKGSAVTVHRKRADEVRILLGDDRIRAGDALRVVLAMPRREQVSAWFIDARGRVDRALADDSITLDPGEHALPGSVIVESPCVDLCLVIVTGSESSGIGQAAFRRAAAENLPPGEAWAPRGAIVRTFRCD
ncbi:MAG TPA: hypothetical protein VKE49_12705 [Myxococcaceae bacterium]|nr:hypothetical protein [Myxococcaceae bacterium]